jgi:hypothetical protein
MAIKIKVQRDYLLTEASIELAADVSQVDEILKASKSNGKMVVLYNQGCIQGINVEQRTKLSDVNAEKVRQLLKLEDVEL